MERKTIYWHMLHLYNIHFAKEDLKTQSDSLNFISASNPTKSELGMNKLDRYAFYLLLHLFPTV